MRVDTASPNLFLGNNPLTFGIVDRVYYSSVNLQEDGAMAGETQIRLWSTSDLQITQDMLNARQTGTHSPL
jgi:hypothetical protein